MYINQLAKKIIQSLIDLLSEDEINIAYILIQIGQILLTMIWAFSLVFGFLLGILISKKTLVDNWISNYSNLILLGYILLVSIPALFVFLAFSNLSSTAFFLYQCKSVKFLSPQIVWFVNMLVGVLSIFFLALIASSIEL